MSNQNNHLSISKYLILFLFSFLIFQTSCQQKDNTAREMPESIGNYIYAFTSGLISRNETVKIRFNASVVNGEQIGKEADDNLFSLSPRHKGSLVWEDDRTLVFKADELFPSGQQFKGIVNLSKVFQNIPEELQSFEFNFRTREQFFSVGIDGIQAVNNEDLSQQMIKGTLYFTDVADIEQVQKILTAKQGSKKLDIDVSQGNSAVEYNFTVNDVDRSDDPSSVTIIWNGKSVEVDEKGSEEVEVPSLKDFKVVNARLVKQAAEPHIVLSFSDPISSDQDMNGLFQISGYSGNLKYTVDGNRVKVFPSNKIVGQRNLTVFAGLLNIAGIKMANQSVWSFEFEDIIPEIRLVGKGVILPESDGLIFPFEAINLNAVEVEVFKIFENNLLQFLQSNEMDGSYDLERVGRIIHREKVNLGSLNPNADKSSWTRYALDLEKLVQTEKGAIYQIRIGFLPGYSDYFCETSDLDEEENLTMMSDFYDEDGNIQTIFDSYYGVKGYYNGYNYRDRNDPCKPAFYNYTRFVKRNIFASNYGIIAKKGEDGSLFVAVNDLRTTDASEGVTVKIFDYQQQLLSSTATNSEGIAYLSNSNTASFVVVEKGIERGYLKIEDGYSLSLSRFDVSGTVAQKGIKGFIYGERGVWRPGDTLYLNFILEDEANKLPEDHPVSMEIYDSRGQLQEKMVKSENLKGIYSFTTSTTADAPTGNWTAKVKVGGASFSKVLKIETVKPNRLKVKVDFGKEELTSFDKEAKGSIQSNWLHGSPASNLKAKVEMQFSQINTTFDKYNDFEFDDPARSFSSEPIVVFDGDLDKEGKADFNINLEGNNAPGKLRAGVKSRVFEKSGDFSSDNFSINYSPYNTYCGIEIPKNKYGEKRLDYNKDYKIDVVSVNNEGKASANRKLTTGIYRLEWSWWWDADEDNFTSYNTSTHYGAISKNEITTDSKGRGQVNVNVADWGRYLIRVCDEEGHCTGDIFYAGYPWNDEEGDNKAAAMLIFTSDKQEYKVNETVEINIPASEVSRGLLTVENGSKVLEHKWFNLQKGENKVRVQTNEAWTPNVFAHVTLTQPHAQQENDLPIRMYGVIPLKVVNPKTQLKPEIRMPEKIEPEKEFTVEVVEKNGNPMAYTIAVVDEGLLDLTRFKTPDPWNTFYAKEALGVKTWDMYDHVLGGYGSDLERILSVGGGADDIAKKKSGEQVNRFKPVVMHLGPFYSKRGQKQKHTITMPNYIGSVRTMVVAANAGAYGSAEVTTPVKTPLMVLATVPRVLGPNEELRVPVNVFAMEKGISSVDVSLETNDNIEIIGDKNQSVSFSKPGDEMVYFKIKVKEVIGKGKIKVLAKSGAKTAHQEIEIAIRNPNPYVTNVNSEVIEAGQSWSQTYAPVGMNGTNETILEVSNIPPIDLGRRLEYLIRYPHGCIEQTTSSGFPQLYVSKLLELDEKQKKQVPKNIQATINRLKNFQVSSGGFGYWPGDDYVSYWGTNYAGHFILEAKKLGYNVPENMLSKWKKYQKKKATQWDPTDVDRWEGDLTQAYRLYTLALAGEAELGAMNRLRSMNMSDAAKWRLAAAYGLAGKKSIAEKLISGLDKNVEDYVELGYTYGSGLRDQSMILETLVILEEKKEAALLVKDISERISQDRWFGTQTVAYSLLSIGKYVGENNISNEFNFTYALDGSSTNAGSNMPIFTTNLNSEGGARNLSVKNTSSGILYARLIQRGIPMQGDSTSASNNLKMDIAYMNSEGKSINPKNIEQGTDFVAKVTISNPSKTGRKYNEMAITQIFPSGWEITNARMDAISVDEGTKPEYQDIRDDRVYTYFDINAGETHTYYIRLNATYEGRYYLPTISCEAMYDNTISARQPGGWVNVVPSPDI